MVNDQDWTPGSVSRFRQSGAIGTPFHRRTAHASRTPAYYSWDLYHVVDIYEDVALELASIRKGVAMGDMSPLSKYVVSGRDAPAFVDSLVTRDSSDLGVGQVLYTPWCNHDGKVINDGLVFRSAEQSYRFTSDPSQEWFTSQAAGLDVTVEDVTSDLGILTLQGPRSRDVLEQATSRDWSDLDFSRLDRTTIAGVGVEVARQGFTGELGYEILTPVEGGDSVWDAVAAAGAPFEIRPAGEYAIEVARVEAGLLIPGYDYGRGGGLDPAGSHTPSAANDGFISSPFELGMESFVNFDKNDFIGKQALADEQAAGGPPRRLVGLDIDWRTIVGLHLDRDIPPNVSPRVRWEAVGAFVDGVRIGRATSVTWGPSVNKMIGFGHLDKRFAGSGTTVSLEWPMPDGDPGRVNATVVELPFLSHRRAS